MAKSAKASFRDSVVQYEQITREVGAKKFAPLYLLMGEEAYFIDRLGDLLADSILDETRRAFNQIVVYGSDIGAADVANHARQVPMMGGRQVIIVKEAQKLAKIDQLTAYARQPVASTVLVLCHKEKTLDKRSALYKALDANGVVLESVPPHDYEIGNWLNDFIRSKGFEMDTKASAMLTDHLGVDIPKIANELDKLVVSLPEGTRRVTADHIEQHIGISKEFNNFELTKALSERNFAKAMTIADHFARNPRENPLVVTVSTLFSHFQRIFIYNYHRWMAQKGKTPMPDDMTLARQMKLPTTFFLNEYKQAATLYPNAKVFKILGLIRECDMKSKGMGGGSADNGELLRDLLLKIILL
ncbi:MAG: DNA polymerase III subunit delta [Rikenellaceae bacterium]|jgi:DNA polymerase-3 subunit delta|nr:DNA polymerase III subunit delta [Rikenellaceae bacterium]